jgi:hypothetical protein
MKILTSIITVAVISLSSSVQAASINEREAAQRNSIRNGYADGSLTAQEARRLRNQQIKLERKEQRFRSDGELSRRERANMQASLDANRARIYRQRHDAQQQD